MAYATVTLSTGSTTTSTPIALNWRNGWKTTVLVTASSSFASDFTLQYSLDDMMLAGGSSLCNWSAVSSEPGQAAQHFNSSVSFPTGVSYTFPSPIAAVRLGSTSNAGMGAGNQLSMRVLQGSE